MWAGKAESGTEKISRVTIATGSKMVLDSSGSCDGDRRMAVGPRRLWLECVTATRWKLPMT
jgi:hypothetical protein